MKLNLKILLFLSFTFFAFFPYFAHAQIDELPPNGSVIDCYNRNPPHNGPSRILMTSTPVDDGFSSWDSYNSSTCTQWQSISDHTGPLCGSSGFNMILPWNGSKCTRGTEYTYNYVASTNDPTWPDDPCAAYETEVDFDGDGICDRCDMNPQDPDEGKYVWLIVTYKEDGIIIAQEYSIISPSEYVKLPAAIADNYTYTAAAGDPDADVVLDDAIQYLTVGSSPAAEMQPCACEEDCYLSTLPGSGMVAGDYDFTGTAMTPDTPPEIILPGSDQPRNFYVPDTPDEHGATNPGTASPGPGATDNEYLDSIASNQAGSNDNLDAIGNTLDAELNEIAGNTARTAANLANLLDEFGSSDGVADGVGADATTELDSAQSFLQGEITSLANTDNMSTGWFSGLTSSIDGLFVDGTCEPLDSYIPSIDKTISISCEFSDKLKIILGFLLSVFTVIELINILFKGISPPGAGDMNLLGK